MANRFWVAGGNGNWSSSTNWSATTGGASGAAAPTSADDVFINALSGTSPTITVDATSNCLSLDFTGAITPTFTGASQLNIFGSVTFILAMTATYSGVLNFSSTATGKTVTTNGLSLVCNITFNGIGGGWTLQDAITTTFNVTLTNGTLDTNGKAITCFTLGSSNSNIRTLTLGASILTLSGGVNFATITNLTFNLGTAVFNLSSITNSFFGGGLTFGSVTFAGTTTTVSGSNAFSTLTLTAGKTVKLTSGTTQTIMTLIANGTRTNLITIQSVTAGSAATISRSSGNQVIRNISLKDITATGGATFYALGTTNVSGNSGWAYQMLIKQEKLSGTEMALYHIDSNGVMQKVSG